MVALPRLEGMSPRRIAMAGGGAGLIAAALVAAMPTALLERLVWTSGIAALVPAAQPPLGVTARAVLAILGGGATGAVCWSVLYLIIGPGGFLAGQGRARPTSAAPVVRRADAHPDAPPRRPISAADLGVPLMDAPPAEQPLPRDFDQPLAAFDPAAIPATPLAPVRAVAPLPRVQPDARIETFALPPIPTPTVVPSAAPAAAAAPPSIEALLRRLEQGARGRVAAH